MTEEQKDKLTLIMDTSISAVDTLDPNILKVILLMEWGEEDIDFDDAEIRLDVIRSFYNASCVDNLLNLCMTDEEWHEWENAIDEYLTYWNSL